MTFAYVPPIALTWFCILASLFANSFAFFLTFRDPAYLSDRMRYTLIPVLILNSYWFIANTLQLFKVINRSEYLELIAPVSPVAFVFVWGAVGFSYIAGSLPRIKKEK